MSSFPENLKISGSDLKRASVIVLILTNMVPIFGVLFLDWRIFPLMFLFWMENIIIGVSNVFKMIFSSADSTGRWQAKASMILFFCVHYGLFTLVHGIFIFIVFGGFIEQDDPVHAVSDITSIMVDQQLWWAVLALFISHTISFIMNYIGKGEYKRSTLAQLMQQPYGRVVILHLTIIFGGFLVSFLGSPVVGLILLIALKTYVDIKAHLNQHVFIG